MPNSDTYQAPGADDFANVFALNVSYLQATGGLTGVRREQLAAIPFLLFSMRQNDDDWWRAAMNEQPQLNPDQLQQSRELREVQTAAISFLWQLVRRDPYVARMISGASMQWCELLAELPLVTLLNRTAWRSDLLGSRFDIATASIGWQRCVHSNSRVRRCAQIAELQALLFATADDNYQRMAAAACTMPKAGVAESTRATSHKKV